MIQSLTPPQSSAIYRTQFSNIYILSYIPTKLAITTSVLCKRWRHVWTETPHLSFEWLDVSPKVINKTLARYSASKITSFHFCTKFGYKSGHLNKSIEFAMSHNVENFSMALVRDTQYNFPDFFSYTNSSMKRVNLKNVVLTPRCTVSWTSLRNLSLNCCKLSDKTFPKIPSGCPILETLTLLFCWSLEYLDLSKSLCLTRLEIERGRSCHRATIQSMQIVAPHIQYLRLRDCEAHCTFFDVSSLTEADVDVIYFDPRTCHHNFGPLDPNDLLVMVQKMIEAFQNVEKLALGVNLLQMLSLSKIPTSLPLPMLKVNNLTLETRIMRSVVPGIERLLQNSPGLNKLTVYNTTESCHAEPWGCVNRYLKKQCWRLEDKVFPTSWEYKVVEPKVVGSFMERFLANTKTLETLVVRLSRNFIARSTFEELSQISLTLSHNNNVSIVLKRTGG